MNLQENASRPEGVRPSQGGKFVGFGSTPPSQRHSQNNGVDDVTAMFSKGWNNISQIAGVAAGHASASIKRYKDPKAGIIALMPLMPRMRILSRFRIISF